MSSLAGLGPHHDRAKFASRVRIHTGDVDLLDAAGGVTQQLMDDFDWTMRGTLSLMGVTERKRLAVYLDSSRCHSCAQVLNGT